MIPVLLSHSYELLINLYTNQIPWKIYLLFNVNSQLLNGDVVITSQKFWLAVLVFLTTVSYKVPRREVSWSMLLIPIFVKFGHVRTTLFLKRRTDANKIVSAVTEALRHVGIWGRRFIDRVHLLTLRWLMSYIYGAPILDVSRSHTTTQHSR